MEKVTVSANALFALLDALNGPDHLVREMMATRGPLVGDDNPINILVKEYNQQVEIHNAGISSDAIPAERWACSGCGNNSQCAVEIPRGSDMPPTFGQLCFRTDKTPSWEKI